MKSKFSPGALRKAQKAVAREAVAKKNTFKVGDPVWAADPFEKHKMRGAVVIAVNGDKITVQFLSTKGSSYSKDTAENRKVIQVAGVFVAVTSAIAHLTASELQHR